MRFSPLSSRHQPGLQQPMLSYKIKAVCAPFDHRFARCKIPDSSCGGSSRREGSNLLHGLGTVGAAVLGTFGVDALKTRRISSTGASSSNSSSGVGRAVCSIGAVGAQDEEIGVGDFCPLYSDLPSVGFSPSLAAGARHLRRGRRRDARGAATSENGILIDAAQTYSTEEVLPRVGKVSRVTKETSVDVHINLDGTGICSCNTGIPFLDHMLDQLASHGLLDVKVMATGDIHIDDHHTNEDVGLAVGTALLQALGNRKGIFRFGDFSAPLDEALVHVVLDLSGRPYLGYDVNIPTQRVGTYDTQLVEHFFQSIVNTSGMTLHIRQLAGKNSHHIIEATFKAFARALRQAIEYDIKRKGTVPSSKGVLSRA